MFVGYKIKRRQELYTTVDKHLFDYGIDLHILIQDLPKLSHVCLKYDGSSDFKCAEKQFSHKSNKQGALSLSLSLHKTSESLQLLCLPNTTIFSPYPANFSEKLLLLSVKLEALFKHPDTLKSSLHKFSSKASGLPSFLDALKTAEDEFIRLRQKIGGTITSQFTRDGHRRNCIYSPESELAGDDVAYDHSLAPVILSHPHSRIHEPSDQQPLLSQQQQIRNSGYYDGSRIKLKGCRYLALHAPRKENTGLFYLLLIQSGVRIVLCLMEPWESSGRGYTYWPESGKTLKFDVTGPDLNEDGATGTRKVFVMMVTNREETHQHYTDRAGVLGLEYLTHRRLHVRWLGVDTDGEESGEILGEWDIEHLHYRGWEDMEAPESMVTFLSVLDKCVRLTVGFGPTWRASGAHDPPVAVHCHAGVGRTGTFILAHALISGLCKRRRLDATVTSLGSSAPITPNTNPNPNTNTSVPSCSQANPLSASAPPSLPGEPNVVNAVGMNLTDQLWKARLGEAEINPYLTLAKLRLQRESVQSPRQLAFAIAAVRHFLDSYLNTVEPTSYPNTRDLDVVYTLVRENNNSLSGIEFLQAIFARAVERGRIRNVSVPSVEDLQKHSMLTRESWCHRLAERLAKMDDRVVTCFMDLLTEPMINLEQLEHAVNRILGNERHLSLQGLSGLEERYMTDNVVSGCCRRCHSLHLLFGGRFEILKSAHSLNSYRPTPKMSNTFSGLGKSM